MNIKIVCNNDQLDTIDRAEIIMLEKYMNGNEIPLSDLFLIIDNLACKCSELEEEINDK